MTIKQYAFIKGSDVVNTALFDDPSEELLSQFKEEHDIDLIILTDGVNGECEVGGTYEEEIFFPIQPYSGWIKDFKRKMWMPPIPYPEDGQHWVWDYNDNKWLLKEDVDRMIQEGLSLTIPDSHPDYQP